MFCLARYVIFCLDTFNTQSHSTQKMRLANHSDAKAVCVKRGNNIHVSQLQQLAATGLAFPSDMARSFRLITKRICTKEKRLLHFSPKKVCKLCLQPLTCLMHQRNIVVSMLLKSFFPLVDRCIETYETIKWGIFFKFN